MTDSKPAGPQNDQAAYDLGYENPSTPSRNWTWRHLVFVNAFGCGQADYQNNQPRNAAYSMDQYDFPTCERKSNA